MTDGMLKEHPLLKAATRNWSQLWDSPTNSHITTISLAAFSDGYTAGVRASADWLRAREYTAEAEALEASIANTSGETK